MLKRYQIMLNDWLADFAKERAREYDISFSEAIRIGLCVYYSHILSEQYPECNVDLSCKEMVENLKRYSGTPEQEEEMHKEISRIYFEARKAIDCVQKKKAADKA
jgi:hypothetical protein